MTEGLQKRRSWCLLQWKKWIPCDDNKTITLAKKTHEGNWEKNKK